MRILRKRQRQYLIIISILLSLFCLLALVSLKGWVANNAFDLNLLFIDKGAPFEKEITKIIEPLRYDGIHTLLKPDFGITLDFENKAWIMHNVRDYDGQGKLILEDGRYGVCGELAAYVYDRIRPLFENKSYQVEFVSVSESGYFISPRSTHVAIKITETSMLYSDKTFILDPSFRRYGSIDKFDDYRFYRTYKTMPFMVNKERDLRYEIGIAFPLLIKNNNIVFLSVKSVNDRFDKDNFAVILSMNKRNAFAGRPLVILSKLNGKKEVFKYRYPEKPPLSKQQFDKIFEKLTLVFEKL